MAMKIPVQLATPPLHVHNAWQLLPKQQQQQLQQQQHKQRPQQWYPSLGSYKVQMPAIPLMAGVAAFLSAAGSGGLNSQSCRKGMRQKLQSRRVTRACVASDASDDVDRRAVAYASVGGVAAWAAGTSRDSTAYAASGSFTSLGNEVFSVQLPGGFTWNDKLILVPTHQFEQRVTANAPYTKWIVGVTIDEVMVNSLADVGSVEQTAERIKRLEQDKDGNLLTEILAASRGEVNGVTADTIEYRSDTTRGFNHFLLRVALNKGKLYNITSQVPEDQWPEVKGAAQGMLTSMKLKM